MKNAGLTIGMVAIGLGLASIGFNLNGNQANATPATPVAFNTGPDLPTIVWYDSHEIRQPDTSNPLNEPVVFLVRAWSDGGIEGRFRRIDAYGINGSPCEGVVDFSDCVDVSIWFVLSSPNDGLNVQADINFDSRVNAEDLGIMLAAWGEAPRNDYPPSDCPLGLIP